MSKNPNQTKNSAAFKLTLLSAVLILLNSSLIAISAEWLPWLLPVIPGSSGNNPLLLYMLSAIGLSSGIIVLLGTIALRSRPQSKTTGISVAISSVPSLICGGGFLAGVIFAIIGGAAAYSPDIAEKLIIKPIVKMSDSSGRMNIEGSGPKIMAPLLLTFAVTAGLSYLYQPLLNYPTPLQGWTYAIGILLLAVGIPFWLSSVVVFFRAWQHEQLATRGPFALMPNPIYGGFIVFVIPGVSLVLGWWPVLLSSVVMLIAHRIFISKEDEGLQEKFGSQYIEYKRRVLIKYL